MNGVNFGTIWIKKTKKSQEDYMDTKVATAKTEISGNGEGKNVWKKHRENKYIDNVLNAMHVVAIRQA